MTSFDLAGAGLGGLGRTKTQGTDRLLSSSTGSYDTGKTEAPTNPDIDYIEKNGFMAYVRHIEEEKIKEMREEMLRAMGLDEEKLAALPAKERQAIEKSINEEIQRRLAASDLANQGEKTGESKSDQQNRQRAELAIDPRMFTVLADLQGQTNETQNGLNASASDQNSRNSDKTQSVWQQSNPDRSTQKKDAAG